MEVTEQKERRYVSPDAVQKTLDRLALERGLTRAELDEEIERFSSEPTDGEHLAYLEVANLQTLSSDRERHLKSCERCRSLVDAFHPTEVVVRAFREAAEGQLADFHADQAGARRGGSRKGGYATPTTIAACLMLGMAAALYLNSKDPSRVPLSALEAPANAALVQRSLHLSSNSATLSREDHLAQMVLTSQKEDLRIKGAEIWAQEGVRAVHVLTALSRTDPSPRVRERATAALAMLNAVGEESEAQLSEAAAPKESKPKRRQ